jgi:hypothetical protein
MVKLTIVAADTGNPVPNVPINYHVKNGRWSDMKTLQASRAGIAMIPYTTATTELELITRTEAFADTRLLWQTKDGAIPEEYTLRLKRGRQIGGKVVNSRGELVSGATVSFGMPMPDPELSTRVESHEVTHIEITAQDGTWQTLRIPETLLTRMHASASHPDYAGSDTPRYPMGNDALKSFFNGTHVFRLRDGMTVRGIVVNQKDEPIPHAKVLVGRVPMSDAVKGEADSDGRFEIRGCTPEKTVVTASAPGYGARTVAVKPPVPDDGYRIVLEPGRRMKLRVVNKAGEPVPKVTVALRTLDDDFMNGQIKEPQTQVAFSKKTDTDGRIDWNEAPSAELRFELFATGYMRVEDVKIPADGVEHTVTMPPALKISGTVRDAMSGVPIPKFKVIAGHAQSYVPPGETKEQIYWSPIDRHWLSAANGKFERVWEEPIVFGAKENRFAFKIEADGYRPFLTRIVAASEAEVKFDIALQRGATPNITILDPDGKPAADVSVTFPTTRSMTRIVGHWIERRTGDSVRMTDNKGQIQFSGEDVVKIIAAGNQGFALVNPADLGADGIIRLQRWGRVEGRMLRRGQPLADAQVHLGARQHKLGTHLQFGGATTDHNGRFTFEPAPAGLFDFMRLTPTGDSEGSFAHVPLREVQIVPGETTTLTIDQMVTKVELRLRWPEGFKPAANQRIFCNASTVLPNQPTPEQMTDREFMIKWRESPEVKAAIENIRNVQFKETAPDVWTANDVPAGNWTLGATVIDGNLEPGKPYKPALAAQHTFQISGEAMPEKINLGELAMAPPKS